MASAQYLNGNNDFIEILKKFARNWPYFIISLAVAMTYVYGFLYITPQQYKVSSTLLIQDDKNGTAMSSSTAFSDLNMFQTVKTVDNEIEVLRSRDLIYKVLSELHLETSYFKKDGFNGFKTKELYGKTLPFKIEVLDLKSGAYARNISIASINDSLFKLTDSTVKVVAAYGALIKNKNYVIRVAKGPAFSNSYGSINIKFNDLYNLTEAYSLAKLRIAPVVKDANTVVISVSDNVPQRGIDLLTLLIQTYNINNVNKKNIIAQSTIKFIDNRLRYLVDDLSSSEHDVESFKQQNQVADINIDAQLNATRSVDYNQMLSSSATKLSLINSIERYFKGKQGQSNLAPSAMGIEDPILNGLIAKFNDLQLEKNRMLRTANAENPLVLNLNDQLSALRINILENLNSIKDGFKIERNNLLTSYSQYSNKSKSGPSIERGLLERSREQSVKSGLYRYLIQKREETALSLSTTIPSSQIIDKPAYNTTPESPKRKLLYLCGFMFGFFLPAGVIYARGFFNNKVTNARTIELTGARLLGELSHNLDKNTNVFQKDNRSTISELFRYIRMNLDFMTSKGSNKVILVTSSMQGEGKTFFTINLATALGMRDKKVIILEFDLRRPTLLKKLDLTSEFGFTDYIKNDTITVEKIIQPSLMSQNVSVIGCGEIPDDPAEIMTHPKVSQLVEELKERFDYVIIDTSPVGQVADAFSLARHVDVSIYVVRYNYTNNYQMAILKDICDENKLNNLLVVFNDAKREKNQKYSYAGYGYAMTN
ncbi:tyrosine-protein kinase family protein [Pedobacter sp. B4-66]|uniref:GumC family protein n=1 Tax=Pedobacter sp. B4-66 TaxID=2817280 RepID=UPI001BD912E3|nr:tyrosine-protein kinase family protein [Pedobacter sp. B4-66]